MRIKATMKNSVYTLVFQMAILIVGFFIPRFIIQAYGSEVNGFAANVTQILNLINLLQAGTVGASIYEMYKPIAENDYERIGRIFFSSERYFKKVSYLFFFCTLLIIPYILFFTENQLGVKDVIFSVVFIGANATYVFRDFCKYDIIFSAHQRKYELVISQAVEKVVYYLLLVPILYFKWSFILMYVAALIGSVAKVFYLKYKYRKDYKSSIHIYKNSSKYKIANQNKLLGNQIIQHMVEVYPTVTVSVFYGLKFASVLQIYAMVVNVFKMVFTTLQNSVAASFGDLIARNDKKKTIEIYNIIQFIFIAGSLMFYIPMSVLMLPFVGIYTSNISDVTYVYSGLANCIVAYICSYTLFLPYNMFINASGMYGKVLKKNAIYGFLSLIIAIVCCKYDFQYIFVGGIIYYSLSIIDRYYVLKKNSVSLKLKNLLPSLGVIIFIFVGSYFINSCLSVNSIINTWTDWIIGGFCSVVLAFFILIILSVFIYIPEIKGLKKYILKK